MSPAQTLALALTLATAASPAFASQTWNGQAWNGQSWNGQSWNGQAWNGQAWNGQGWNGLNWNGTAAKAGSSLAVVAVTLPEAKGATAK